MKKRRTRKKKSALGVAVFALCAAALVYVAFSFLLYYFVKPVISDYGTAKLKSIAVYAISEIVEQEMSRVEERYRDLIIIETAADGSVTSITSDIVKINTLKAVLSQQILERISVEMTELEIPLGNFLGSEIFSGRGPNIKFQLVPYSAIYTDIESVFNAAGINQTRHQTMLNIKITMGILTGGTSVDTEIETAICISETVVVGRVPQNYTNVEQGDDPIDEIIANYVD